MEKNTTAIFKKPIMISRRFFNKLTLSFSSIISFIGLSKTTIAKEEEPEHEVLIIPEEFREKYSPQTKEVLYNHIKSGTFKRKEIRDNIMDKMSKKIRIK